MTATIATTATAVTIATPPPEARPPQTAAALVGVVWQLTSLNKVAVARTPDSPIMKFDAQRGALMGKIGALLFKAQYEAAAGTLNIVGIATNSPNESIGSFETELLQALSQAAAWRISDGTLYLTDGANAVLATFAAAAQ
jgi:heat shock protein HslJ